MASWGFLTNHARVLLCIAYDPAARLRDMAASLGITERSAYGIVTDLAEAGYVIKQKDGRRNRYQIQAQLPLPGTGTREPAIGEVLALLAGAGSAHRTAQASGPDASGIRQAEPEVLKPAGSRAGHPGGGLDEPGRCPPEA
jgi:hypothetical protein